MTAAELHTIIATTAEFHHDLEDMSSYLASITQERPIIFALAKQLWKRGYRFTLEDDKRDLFINGKGIEFKFNYDCGGAKLRKELERHGDALADMWALVKAKELSKNWGVLARVYEDVCAKPTTDMFVWIILSRDLRNVKRDDHDYINWVGQRLKSETLNPYDGGNAFLNAADSALAKLHAIRGMNVLNADIPTMGAFFPSIYHFRICEFPRAIKKA